MVIFLCKLHGKNLGATTSMFDNSVCLKPLSHWTATVLRQTSRVGRIAVSKQSKVNRNILACVAKWRKVVAKILNMFKNFMQQNSSKNSRKVVAGVSNPSRTCRRPLAI